MAEPVSFWRRIENALDSKTAYYINGVLLVVVTVGLIVYISVT